MSARLNIRKRPRHSLILFTISGPRNRAVRIRAVIIRTGRNDIRHGDGSRIRQPVVIINAVSDSISGLNRRQFLESGIRILRINLGLGGIQCRVRRENPRTHKLDILVCYCLFVFIPIDKRPLAYDMIRVAFITGFILYHRFIVEGCRRNGIAGLLPRLLTGSPIDDFLGQFLTFYSTDKPVIYVVRLGILNLDVNGFLFTGILRNLGTGIFFGLTFRVAQFYNSIRTDREIDRSFGEIIRVVVSVFIC